MDKNNIKEKVILKEVEKIDCRLLYKLLKSRDPIVNISHIKMPTFKEHEKFVLSKPYSKWYIIQLNAKKIGSIYLSKNDEIGIFIFQEYQNLGIGKIVLNILMEKNPRRRFLANTSPKNKKSSNFFKQNGFKLIQHTYEIQSDDDKK